MKSLVLADLIANTPRMIQLRFKGQGISLYQIALFDDVCHTSYTDSSDVEELFTDWLGVLQFQDGPLFTHKMGLRRRIN